MSWMSLFKSTHCMHYIHCFNLYILSQKENAVPLLLRGCWISFLEHPRCLHWDFLIIHKLSSSNKIFPEANSCLIVLRLPVHTEYESFKKYMTEGDLQARTFGVA
ncbi:hypothetical protein GOODEAATRI_024345 [Goodea atripinnis]|uniref:HECT domain-containing protein n=1 Tax=Goodea atripinnis TaxID=208336 RepID=A0ABV0NXB2_9TELE